MLGAEDSTRNMETPIDVRELSSVERRQVSVDDKMFDHLSSFTDLKLRLIKAQTAKPLPRSG